MEHLIHELLNGLPTLALLAFLGVAIAVLVKGADWLVEGAVGLSSRLGIPKVIIGATVVSIGTTTPEAAVSVMAAFKGMPDLALGNAVGSIICDTGLIFGLSCLITRLPIDRFILNRHGWVQFGAGLLLVAVSLLFWSDDGATRIIPRGVGVFFLALLLAYVWASIRWARQHSRTVDGESPEEYLEEMHEIHPPRSAPRNALLLLMGLGMVLIASEFAVRDVEILCNRWGVPPAILAATLIAFGTSLPELVTAIQSIRKGHADLLIGNVIGADILNVLFVVGASACAAPLVVEPFFFRLHYPVMIGILLLFRIAVVSSRGTFRRSFGFLFVGMHLAYVVANYVIDTN